MAEVDEVDGEVDEPKPRKSSAGKARTGAQQRGAAGEPEESTTPEDQEPGADASDADADTSDAEAPDAEHDGDDTDTDASEDDESEDDAEEDGPARSAETDAFWGEVRVDPVEIALPKGVGFTLRAYRRSDEISFSDIDREEDDYTILERSTTTVLDDDPFVDELAEDELPDEDELDVRDEARGRSRGKAAGRRSGAKAGRSDDDEDPEDRDEEDDADADVEDAAADGESDEPDPEDFADEEGEDESADAEEVPVFLGRGGKVYLFDTADALVEFVKSDAQHDLAQLDTWSTLRDRITVDDVVPVDDDRYELDLIVENLRGGPDAWEADLVIAAGEVARDLGYALRLETVLTALSPGSPLDDLDEALRAAGTGGVGGFFARRRLRKIAAQQTALGWRTVIGKISAAVDWRK